MCVEGGSLSDPLCSRTGQTHSSGSLDFGHEDKCAKFAVEPVQSHLLWARHRVGEHEVVPYPLTVHKLHLFVAWSPTEFVYLERSQQGSHQVGLSVDGSFGLGVGFARRRVQVVGRGTTTGVWRVQLAAIR